jgi:hypothetical protein
MTANPHPPGTDKCLHCAISKMIEQYIKLGEDPTQAFCLAVEALAEYIAANHSRAGRIGMVASVNRELGTLVAEKRKERAETGREATDLEDRRLQ